MQIKSLRATISWDGQWVSISKTIPGRIKRTERRISVSEISSITVAPATWAMHGYIQFTVAGTPAARPRRTGLSAGRPAREDMDSMSYSRKHNGAMEKLKAAIEAAIAGPGFGFLPPAAPVDLPAQLQRLADLHASGALSTVEYELAKGRLLSP